MANDGDDPEPKEYYIWGMRPRPQLLIDLTGENRAPVNVAKLNQRTLDWVRELDSRPPLPLSIPKYLMGVPATSPPTKKQRHQETDGQDTKCPTSTEIEALSILALTTSNMKHHKAMMRPK